MEWQFLGPQGPHGIPLLVSWSVPRKKNLDHLYMPHESLEDALNQANDPKGSPICPP